MTGVRYRQFSLVHIKRDRQAVCLIHTQALRGEVPCTSPRREADVCSISKDLDAMSALEEQVTHRLGSVTHTHTHIDRQTHTHLHTHKHTHTRPECGVSQLQVQVAQQQVGLHGYLQVLRTPPRLVVDHRWAPVLSVPSPAERATAQRGGAGRG